MQEIQFCMISLHQRHGIAYVSFLKKKNVLQVRNVKGTPNFMQLFRWKQMLFPSKVYYGISLKKLLVKNGQTYSHKSTQMFHTVTRLSIQVYPIRTWLHVQTLDRNICLRLFPMSLSTIHGILRKKSPGLKKENELTDKKIWRLVGETT